MNFISKHFKSDYSKNVLTLITGTTIAQAIPIAITPILTRLYTPNDFGVFALFLAITAITGAVSNAQYEHAIVLPKDDEDAYNLVFLGIIFSILLSLILLIVIVLFSDAITEYIQNTEIKPFLFLIPISTLLVGVFNSFNYFNIRKNKFKNIAKSQVTRSSSLVVSQILIGLLVLGPIGLIFGQILSYFTGNMILFKTLKKNYKSGYLSKDKIKFQAIKYKNFPLFSMPSVFLNSINLNIVNFLISSLFSISALGFYSLTHRIIGVPAKIIGSSISQVYLKQASDDLNNKKSTKNVFLNTLKKLTIICIPTFFILFFIVEHVFAFVFGEEWRVSGLYARILIPLAAVRFVSSTLSVSLIIHQKQKILLLFNISLFVSIIFVFLISKINSFDIETFFMFYTFLVSIIYLVLLLVNWNVSTKKINQV
tara:strand:+ start:43732 stop:45006 length:1275 start_codon:yes stop_codon:yes gene_type:complete